jgi:hypothetical protein
VEVKFSVNHQEGSRAFRLIFHWKKPNSAEAGKGSKRKSGLGYLCVMRGECVCLCVCVCVCV